MHRVGNNLDIGIGISVSNYFKILEILFVVQGKLYCSYLSCHNFLIVM